ncbi:hypothetical protein PGT21_032544, partial [Puccinia graminis f. sp. tritici]
AIIQLTHFWFPQSKGVSTSRLTAQPNGLPLHYRDLDLIGGPRLNTVVFCSSSSTPAGSSF